MHEEGTWFGKLNSKVNSWEPTGSFSEDAKVEI